MDKQTKLYLGIGLLGAGVYLYFKSLKNMVGFINPKSIAPTPTPKGEKVVMLDLYVGNSIKDACVHMGNFKFKAPICYFSSNPPYLDGFVVGKKWFTNFEQQIKYPNGIYSLYNPSFSSSANGQWAKIVNGVVTEAGTCGRLMPNTGIGTTPMPTVPSPIIPTTTPVPVPNAPTTTPINPRGFAGEIRKF